MIHIINVFLSLAYVVASHYLSADLPILSAYMAVTGLYVAILSGYKFDKHMNALRIHASR